MCSQTHSCHAPVPCYDQRKFGRSMKNILIVSTLLALATVSVQAQGTIKFNNGSNTKVSTNLVAGGAATGITGAINPQYRFALYCSTTATSVNGGATNISGAAGSYAFDDANWTLVAYGSNTAAGQFVSASAVSGATTVSNVAGGASAQFVVIGWSANAGTNIGTVRSWYNGGSPASSGWIGQSAVSGAITLGTSSATAATLFWTNAPAIPGFTLGLVSPGGPVPQAPVITSQPTDKTVQLGASATFTVSAYGTPSPAYQWMFNSTNTIAGATSSTLTINSAQLTNAGTYSVVITNTLGATNSFAATLTVTNSTGNGYVIFANSGASITKIYTNSAVGGSPTGLTASSTNQLYNYALYASANATSVGGGTSPIAGSASSNYAFTDTNWTFVAYGTNYFNGMFRSSGANGSGLTPVPGIVSGATAQFVVIGWSARVGTNIMAVQNWFNNGSPATDGWIGQSAVSGAIILGNGGSIHAQYVLNTNAPALQGFTLGLASPNQAEVYAVPVVPPAVLQTKMTANSLQLSWLTASGSFGVQSAPSPFGPWSDTGWTVTSDGVNSTVTVTASGDNQFYRLVPQ